jgi:hypothetical protein
VVGRYHSLGALHVFCKAPDCGWDGKGHEKTKIDQNKFKKRQATQPRVAF